MNLLKVFQARGGSAPVARERLQILLQHERVRLGTEDLVAKLRDDLIATISRHFEIDPEKIVGDGKRRASGAEPLTSAA
jgi:cell division topological specificity factor